MGTFGAGPFDNDSALDYLDEFLDVESPAGVIRAVLRALVQDGYHALCFHRAKTALFFIVPVTGSTARIPALD